MLSDISQPPWFGQCDASSCAFFLIALGTPQPTHYIGEIRIPAYECGQRVWTAPPRVPALTLKKQFVLTELVAQFRNFQVPHADTVQNYRCRLPSQF
jgi:hypothetical protein